MKEKFFITSIFTICTYLLNLIGFYFLFLKLEVEIIGIFTLVNSIITLGFLTSELGFTTVYYRYSNKKNYEQYFSAFFFIKIIFMLQSIAITLIIITLFQLWMSKFVIYLLLYLLSMIMLSIINILKVNLISIKKVLICSIILLLYNAGKNLSIIYLAFNLTYISDPLLYIYISNFIFEIVFICSLIYFSKKNLINLQKPKKELIFTILKDLKFISVRVLLGIFVLNIGNIILDYSFSHKDLGYVSLVRLIVTFISMISISMIPLHLSLFSYYFEENKMSSIFEITHKIQKYTSILILSIILLVFLNGNLIFSLLLPKYKPALPILLIMIFISFFVGLSRPYESLLLSGKRENIFAFLGIFIYLLQFFLVVLLIPNHFFIFKTLGLGVIGYAIAYTVPWCLYFFICLYFSKKYFNIKPQKQIILYILLAILAFLIVFELKNQAFKFMIKNQILLLIFSSIILLGIFFGELFLFKLLNKDDFIFFIDLLKLKIYKESIKNEINLYN